MTIPLMDVLAHRDRIGPEIDRRIQHVVEHGKWIMGPEVGEFERALEEWVGSPDVTAIGCSNGTDALVLALSALGLEPGQAVVCPAFTFVATAEAVAFLGGVPVFADIEPDTFNLSPESLTSAIAVAREQSLEVVGIIAVDLFGQAANYPAINQIANDMGLWVIADAAQSFGGSITEGTVGSLADVTTTSFFPAKPLGCYGDGGALFTSNPEVAARVRSLQVHGKGSDKYDNVLVGQNSRLDTIQAAILLPKLAILGDELQARQAVADRYSAALGGRVEVPLLGAGTVSAWAQYTLRSTERDAIQARLVASGIGHAVYYPKPLHRQTAYEQFAIDGIDLSVSDQLSFQVISLPMHPYLPAQDVDLVCECILDA